MTFENTKLEDLVDMESPRAVFEEVERIVRLMFPRFDFSPVSSVFADIIKLFRGRFPGYKECNIHYHDLKHTMDCLLAISRMIHGAFVSGIAIGAEELSLALISSLMHDTGYIQSADDGNGTGARYTLHHVDRSIDFMRRYFEGVGYPAEDFLRCRNSLKCTGLDIAIDKIAFRSELDEMLGKMLGAADLLGQMADRAYLEKLPFLFSEFQEGSVPGFESELDLLEKTPGFWEFTKRRLEGELGGVDRYMQDHFRVRWRLKSDLYREAIERNIAYLKYILENHREDYGKHLRRRMPLTGLKENGA